MNLKPTLLALADASAAPATADSAPEVKPNIPPVATKYMPALNPDYDPAAEVRDRPFRDLRRELLGENRAIRHPDSDPRFSLLEPHPHPARPTPHQKSN
jgi:hypothetical protein